MRRHVLFPILAGLSLQPAIADDYLALVQRYADTLIENGVDRFGETHSPMILSILQRNPASAFDKMPKFPSGIRNGDRVTMHGSNVNLDQNVYRVL